MRHPCRCAKSPQLSMPRPRRTASRLRAGRLERVSTAPPTPRPRPVARGTVVPGYRNQDSRRGAAAGLSWETDLCIGANTNHDHPTPLTHQCSAYTDGKPRFTSLGTCSAHSEPRTRRARNRDPRTCKMNMNMNMNMDMDMNMNMDMDMDD
eukprot:3001270-Prymnesium_polylepis.1